LPSSFKIPKAYSVVLKESIQGMQKPRWIEFENDISVISYLQDYKKFQSFVSFSSEEEINRFLVSNKKAGIILKHLVDDGVLRRTILNSLIIGTRRVGNSNSSMKYFVILNNQFPPSEYKLSFDNKVFVFISSMSNAEYCGFSDLKESLLRKQVKMSILILFFHFIFIYISVYKYTLIHIYILTIY
jgi:hypothetical protein